MISKLLGGIANTLVMAFMIVVSFALASFVILTAYEIVR
ncbi:hypothetical protein LCGC14_1075310 [marine sediment metagenome]|uniref:Uncharacterized protein n=1 Tax=marine sediment metagenome TaxID=412755 RepID=A0A0F9N4A3_9ZZZZ